MELVPLWDCNVLSFDLINTEFDEKCKKFFSYYTGEQPGLLLKGNRVGLFPVLFCSFLRLIVPGLTPLPALSCRPL